jgi:hypothetical protein
MTPRLRALSAAHALAFQARCGRLDRPALSHLVRKVTADLPEGDDVRDLVTFFAGRLPSPYDRPAMIEAGEELQRGVLRALRPSPDARADIHG